MRKGPGRPFPTITRSPNILVFRGRWHKARCFISLLSSYEALYRLIPYCYSEVTEFLSYELNMTSRMEHERAAYRCANQRLMVLGLQSTHRISSSKLDATPSGFCSNFPQHNRYSVANTIVSTFVSCLMSGSLSS